MLKDRYFYPLAALIVAAMIAFALSFGSDDNIEDADIWRNGYTVEGEALSRLTAQPGTQSEYIAATGGEPAFARLTSTAARASLPGGPGVFAPIGPDYERAFAGLNLRLTITARSSRVNPLTEFDIGYFTAGAGDSGWKRRTLSDDWAEYTMEFTPGALTQEPDLDYFSIWPGETSQALSMDVKRMRVEVLNPPL